MDQLADIQLSDLLGGDEQTAQQRAQALAAALRQKQAQAQQQEFMGGLGSVFGAERAGVGKSYASLGAQNYAQAGEQLQQLQEVPQKRLRMALERQQAAKGQRENDVADARAKALADPESITSQVRTGLGTELGLNVPENTPGAALDDKELELAERRMSGRERNAAARQRVAAMAQQAQIQLSPEAIDQMANLWVTTGQMPQLGMGKSGGQLKAQVLNRGAQLSPGANLAGNKAEYHSNTASLGKQQTQSDLMEAAEQTALKNLDTFSSMASKVRDTGSPLFNMGGREFSRRVMGDPAMAAFEASRQTAVQEIGKVLSGSVGGGGISDSARAEVNHLIGPDATVAQIMAAAAILKKDMANRKSAVEGQIAHTRARMGGAAPGPASGGRTVNMKFPDGSVHPVPESKLDAARAKGGVEVSS